MHRTSPGHPRWCLAVCVAFVLGALPGCARGQPSAAPPDPGLVGALEASYTSVVRRVLPSVVEIKSPTGVGSGVIYDAAGHVVTNAHVVGQHTEFEVRLSTGLSYPAALVSSFPPDDIAVIQLRGATDLVPATFGRSSHLMAGDIVMAMGSPLGLESSVTDGIVSAVGRTVPEPPGPSGPGTVLRQVIQTSAPINPGNSGGALVDAAGAVVGIPTLAATNPELGSAAPGIGFAIPVDVARDLADQMIGNGRVVHSRRAALGVTTTTVTDPRGAPVGVGVVDVRPGGPAATAGIRPGDVIIAIAGQPVTDVVELQEVLASHDPGQRVDVTVRRGTETQTVPIVLEELAAS